MARTPLPPSMSGVTARARRCERAIRKSRHDMRSLNLHIVAGAAAILAAAGFSAAYAQQPQTVRVRGTIEKVDGNSVVVKPAQGSDVTLTLTPDARIVGVVK